LLENCAILTLPIADIPIFVYAGQGAECGHKNTIGVIYLFLTRNQAVARI